LGGIYQNGNQNLSKNFTSWNTKHDTSHFTSQLDTSLPNRVSFISLYLLYQIFTNYPCTVLKRLFFLFSPLTLYLYLYLFILTQIKYTKLRVTNIPVYTSDFANLIYVPLLCFISGFTKIL
jgi:hypothetical protein